ncbi:MAG TPA: hypothetical protein VME92_18275 [Acetobacteraceae bacterium]|nr:hypothetical protein [Acetobacteraceae bacterium]
MNPVYLVRFDRHRYEDRVDTLVAFMSSAAFDAAALNAAVTREVERALAPDELIILTRAVPGFDVPPGLVGRDFDALLDRVAGQTRATLLCYGPDGREKIRQPLGPGDGVSGAGLTEILRRGATEMFRRHGGFMEPNANYHFEGPAGRHTNRFMRLSNILVRQAEIAFLAVAVMGLIPPEARFAYIDTPALYAVVSAVNEQWRTMVPDRPPLMADNFRSYEGLDHYEFSDYGEAVVLISASSSGGLAGRLVARGFAPSAIVHLLFHGKDPGSIKLAVDLRRDARSNPDGYAADREIYERANCKLCEGGSVPIPLKGDQFDIQGPQPEALLVNQKDAPTNVGRLMGRLAGTRALTVTSGHRQHWIEVARMMEAPGFLERLEFFVRRSVPAGVEHCVLADREARPLADRIKAITGSPMALHEREEIDRTGRDPNDPGAMLVVASVIGSGRSLLEISRDLREVCKTGSIIYLVGFAKIEGEERRDALKRTLVHSHHHAQHMFEVVEELLLPGQATPNPWQQELELLQKAADAWPAGQRGWLDGRLDRLRKASEPMTDSLFVPADGATTLKLQAGFAFWPKVFANNSQADVFFTISAVMQRLRTAPVSAGDQALRTNWLQQTLLSPENFGRFNDGVIQASILRAARAAELDYRDDAKLSDTAKRIVRRVLEAADRARGEAAVEFIIAIGCGRLRLKEEHVADVLRPIATPPALVDAFGSVVRRELGLT